MRSVKLGWMCALAAALSGQVGQPLSMGSEYCCQGGFSAERVLSAARSLARLDTARVKLYQFSDRREDQRPRGGATDRNITDLVADYLKEAAIHRHFGLYLSTSRGEAVDVWDGFHR